MRPCAKKKKESAKGFQTILDPPCYSPCPARRPAKVKITSDVSASSLDITKPVHSDVSVLYRVSEQPGPGTQTSETKQGKGGCHF